MLYNNLNENKNKKGKILLWLKSKLLTMYSAQKPNLRIKWICEAVTF